MPKMKSRKAVTKRVKITGTGKLKRKCANMSHLAPIRSQKQKRHLRKARLKKYIIKKNQYQQKKLSMPL